MQINTTFFSRPYVRTILIAAFLLLLCFVSYGPALNAPLNWDDPIWLTENSAVRHSDLSWIWQHIRSASSYYPLTLTSYWFEYRLWEFWFPGYRLVNIVLHATSAFLLWQVLKKMRIPGALLAAIIWAIHPIQVESVVWITERKNTLSGVFFFSALLTWLRVIEPEVSRRSKIIAYIATMILLEAALLAKGSTVFFPVAAWAVAWLYTKRFSWKHFFLVLPMFATAGHMALLTMLVERNFAANHYGDMWELSFAQRFALSGHCFWFYIQKLLWPTEFAQVYPRWELKISSPLEYLPVVSAILLMAGLLLLAWIKKIRGPFVAMLIYLAAIFPIIGFFKFYTQIYTYVADHYAYLAAAAIIVLVAALLTTAWQWILARAATANIPAWTVPAVSAILVATLTIQSCGHAFLYLNHMALWQETLRISPKAWIAYNSVGIDLYEQHNMVHEALDHFLKGIELYRDPRLLSNAGLMMELMGKIPEAKAYYEEAIAQKVVFYSAYNRLALIKINEGDPRRAIELCEQALELDAERPELWATLGDAYRKGQQPDMALAAYRHCVELNPKAGKCYIEAGEILEEKNQPEPALALYRETLRYEPNNLRARQHIVAVLKKLGRDHEAQREDSLAKQLEARINATSRPATRPRTSP